MTRLVSTRNKQQTYSIRQVIELTGVSEYTLRGWELRYKALSPLRTDAGRRRYTGDDILKVKKLIDLLNHGHRIGAIAHLGLSQLQRLNSQKSHADTGEVLLDKSLEDFFSYVEKFEWQLVYKILNKKRKQLNAEKYIFLFILPVIGEMNKLVLQNKLSIAQEHILSSMLREQILFLKSNKLNLRKKCQLIIATPEGDYHELGILIASVLANMYQIPNLYLGPNMPKNELCEASLRYRATHVLLASTIGSLPQASEQYYSYVNFIDRHLPRRCELWLAGKAAETQPVVVSRAHQILLNFTALKEQLIKMK